MTYREGGMEGESKTNGGEKEKIEGIRDREGEREKREEADTHRLV